MLLNLSCTALMNPQEQPVNLIDDINKIYLTTCSGLAETTGTCHIKAKRTCSQGYKVLDEISELDLSEKQIEELLKALTDKKNNPSKIKNI